jgi:3-dehydroquinate synthase
LADTADTRRLRALLERFGLPTAIPAGMATDALLARMRLDKKNRAGVLRLVFWHGIGRAEIAENIDATALRAVLS